MGSSPVGWGGMGCGLGKHPLGSCPCALSPETHTKFGVRAGEGPWTGPGTSFVHGQTGWAARAGWAQSPDLGNGGNSSPWLMIMACPLAVLVYFLHTLCKPETGQASEGLAVP